MPATDYHLARLAQELAQVLHFDQKRSDGEPYFKHVRRVAISVAPYGYRAQTLAYLHDIVEDSDHEFELWQALWILFSDSMLLDDLSMLTRDEGESYTEYIDYLIEHGSDDVLRVKLADLEDNLAGDPGTRRKRYLETRAKILEKLEG